MEESKNIKEFYTCPNCGRAARGEKKKFFTCPECGRALCEESKLAGFDDNYCGNCGTKITSARDEALVKVYEYDENIILLKQDEIAALEAMQEVQSQDKQIYKTHFSDTFFVMPDDNEKTITIMPDVPGAVLKINVNKARVLLEIIQNQIQGWI